MRSAKTRTQSISAKVTPDELAQLRPLMAGKKPAEWMREVLVAQAKPDPFLARLLAEVLATRAVFVNVMLDWALGELTAETIKLRLEEADSDKLEKAKAILEQVG